MEFCMGNKTWQIAAFILGAVAVGAGVCAFTQHNQVIALTGQLAAATADAKQAHDTASSLSTKLADVTKDAQQAHEQATATKAQATAEEQQLQMTTAKLAAETRPDLPVNLTFHKGLLSAGLVGVFRNTSNKELEFTLDVQSPATDRHLRRAIVINPNGSYELGTREGWAFAPDQRITLNNPAFRPIVRTVGG
jgi:septal ring factor EnvC (AmiA/AmiB activator)